MSVEMCVVCLDEVTNRAATSCKHYFCFDCISKWIKIRNVCPTCKQEVNAIYYDIVTQDEYKVMKIQSRLAKIKEANRLAQRAYEELLYIRSQQQALEVFLSEVKKTIEDQTNLTWEDFATSILELEDADTLLSQFREILEDSTTFDED